MRSSDVHHLDLEPMALRNYCFATQNQAHKAMMEPYSRPSFALFRQHTASVISRYRLQELRLLGRAHGLRFANCLATVETDRGSISAKRVLLAIGASEHASWPRWGRCKLQERLRSRFQPQLSAGAFARLGARCRHRRRNHRGANSAFPCAASTRQGVAGHQTLAAN